MDKNQLAIFENFKIRRHFDEKKKCGIFCGGYYSGTYRRIIFR